MRKRIPNPLLYIFPAIAFPFLFVYFLGVTIFKKAALIVSVFFGALFGIFMITNIFVALLGKGDVALKEFIAYGESVKHFVFVEIPQDLPNKINMIMAYVNTHPLVKNLLVMWMIGFLLYQFSDLMHIQNRRVSKKSFTGQNQNPEQNQNIDETENYRHDPTDGFTKAHFTAYFPEGWQERRADFFRQIKEIEEEKKAKTNEK